MSKFYDQADAIAAALAAKINNPKVTVIVDRQHDVISEVRKVIGKQTGNLVLVAWAGGPNNDESADGPRIESVFNVTIFSKPVIRKGEMPADDLAELIANFLHDWRQNPDDPFYQRLVCTGIFPQDAPNLLIHQIRLKTPSQL